jgi:hypothetical protein
MNPHLIAALKHIIAKKLFNIHDLDLKEALFDWVKKWRPSKLLKLYSSSPEVFDDLPKGPKKPLYREVALRPKTLDDLIEGKSFRCKRDIESWSIDKRIRSEMHEKGSPRHQVVFKKNIPSEDRLVFIPDVELGFKASDFSNEGEVITLCQTVTAKDIVRILPASGYYDEEKFWEIKNKNYNKAFTLETFKKIRKSPLKLPAIKKLAIEKFKENQKRPDHLDEFEDHAISLPQSYRMTIYHPKGKKPWFQLDDTSKFLGDSFTYEKGKWKK